MSSRLATQAPQLDVAVTYYGVAPKIEDIGNIKATLMLHYARLDERVNAALPAFKQALDKSNISRFIICMKALITLLIMTQAVSALTKLRQIWRGHVHRDYSD